MTRRALTLVELLVVLGTVMILAAMILPAVQSARSAARRMSCVNKMRQLLIAGVNHEAAFSHLPSGTAVADINKPYHSWLVDLLPYLELSAVSTEIANSYQTSKDPFNPTIHPYFSRSFAHFACSEDSRSGESQFVPRYDFSVGLTSYLGCNGRSANSKDGLLFADSSIRLRDITDGLSTTILFGERPPSFKFDYGWWYAGVGNGSGELDHHVGSMSLDTSRFGRCFDLPYLFRTGNVTDECAASHFWSLHPGDGANFAFMDGSIRFFSYSSASVIVDLSTRAGGEVASPD